jgi:putative peptide zinc metalloprotease protein
VECLAVNQSAVEQLWFRMAKLTPKLGDHVRVHRQVYRDQIWYTYQDRTNNSFYRFSQDAHTIIAWMDGKRTVQQLWEKMQTTQNLQQVADKDDLLQLLAELHKANLIQSNLKADSDALYQRTRLRNPSLLNRLLQNPISWRIPLYDPERLLSRAQPLAHKLFGLPAFFAWLGITLLAVTFALAYVEELSAAATSHLLQPKNLLLFALIYPVVKLFHELGHALAVKRWGGEVHEIGILLVLLFPIPYVDASGASAFSSKYQKMVVGAAGILVEILLAALALFVWLIVEPGIVRSIAFDTLLICGISTLFFNGNPLLRYDGYYVLADAIEIPNLAKRSRQYLSYLLDRYIIGNAAATRVAMTAGETKWLLSYAPLSFFYRMFILTVIVLMVTDVAFVLGLLLAALIIFNQILWPGYSSAKRLLFKPGQPMLRRRSLVMSSLLLTPIFYLVFFAPFPLFTLAQGVIWLPNDAQLSAQTEGFVSKVLVAPNSTVKAGDPILELEDPLLHTSRKIVQAQILALEKEYKANWVNNRVKSRITLDEIQSLKARLAQIKEREQALLVRSSTTGTFVVPDTQDLLGCYLNKGDLIGYVMNPSSAMARVVIPESDMGYLSLADDVAVIFAGNASQPVVSHINRIIPEASYQLPSPALGSAGGGEIVIDPLDSNSTRAMEKVFEIELTLPSSAETQFIGRRLFVRFDHGTQSLAGQWLHSLQQVFLRRFSL